MFQNNPRVSKLARIFSPSSNALSSGGDLLEAPRLQASCIATELHDHPPPRCATLPSFFLIDAATHAPGRCAKADKASFFFLFALTRSLLRRRRQGMMARLPIQWEAEDNSGPRGCLLLSRSS